MWYPRWCLITTRDGVKSNVRPTDAGRPQAELSVCREHCTSIQANALLQLPNQLSFTLYSTTPTAMAELDQRTDDYHPKDALGDAIKATLVTGGAGAFISTIQNTLTKQNVGAWGVFTRSGSTIGIFGMLKKDLDRVHRETIRD
jgi:hypothetical protein